MASKRKQSKKDKERVNQDVRGIQFFKNYDLYGPAEGDETSPGTGLHPGGTSPYKSVGDFIENSRKRFRKRRKQALAAILSELE